MYKAREGFSQNRVGIYLDTTAVHSGNFTKSVIQYAQDKRQSRLRPPFGGYFAAAALIAIGSAIFFCASVYKRYNRSRRLHHAF
ncbi:hypothetical protein ANACOL_03461 [Anaerotruncus colihominis DSM 17241]|uniref:Uncharacterized protein n=1 Tax=Anaerotruncus colihominis DSM 17241 TaxID=445972 RepID=B0PF82_9FIRM|nr:hypothetical protein ANACOL_03461 [Anaerotruncus colihominis DSM 17241]